MRSLLLSVLLLAGCVANSGEVPTVIQTQVQLGNRPYRIVATNVEGGDKGYVIFGLGGEANQHVAMGHLRQAAGIRPGTSRALINLTYDEQTTWIPFIILPFVVQDSITFSADVIEFLDVPADGDQPAPVDVQSPSSSSQR